MLAVPTRVEHCSTLLADWTRPHSTYFRFWPFFSYSAIFMNDCVGRSLPHAVHWHPTPLTRPDYGFIDLIDTFIYSNIQSIGLLCLQRISDISSNHFIALHNTKRSAQQRTAIPFNKSWEQFRFHWSQPNSSLQNNCIVLNLIFLFSLSFGHLFEIFMFCRKISEFVSYVRGLVINRCERVCRLWPVLAFRVLHSIWGHITASNNS